MHPIAKKQLRRLPPTSKHYTRGGIPPWMDYAAPDLWTLRRESGALTADRFRRMQSVMMSCSGLTLLERTERARHIAKGMTRDEREIAFKWLTR